MSVDRLITRRNLLKRSEVAVGGMGVMLFGGCTTDKEPTAPAATFAVPPKSPFTPPALREQTPQRNPEVTLQELQRVMNVSIDDYNRALDQNIDKQNAVNSLVLVPTLRDYQRIVAQATPDYIPRNETDRPALTHNGKIYIYKESLDLYFKNIVPANQREDFIERILTHELAHWQTPEYKSSELYELVWKEILANVLAYRGLDLKEGYVQGAKVSAHANGKLQPAFENVEETEAHLIEEYITSFRGKPSQRPVPLGTYQTRINTLNRDLLTRISPDYATAIKTLAKFRSKKGGREEYGKMIGSVFKIPEQDQLLFGMSVLYTIDTNSFSYGQLVGRPTIYKETPDPVRR